MAEGSPRFNLDQGDDVSDVDLFGSGIEALVTGNGQKQRSPVHIDIDPDAIPERQNISIGAGSTSAYLHVRIDPEMRHASLGMDSTYADPVPNNGYSSLGSTYMEPVPGRENASLGIDNTYMDIADTDLDPDPDPDPSAPTSEEERHYLSLRNFNKESFVKDMMTSLNIDEISTKPEDNRPPPLPGRPRTLLPSKY